MSYNYQDLYSILKSLAQRNNPKEFAVNQDWILFINRPSKNNDFKCLACNSIIPSGYTDLLLLSIQNHAVNCLKSKNLLMFL